MQQGNKPFPPFGALFNQLLKTNLKLKYSPWVFCGKTAWADAAKANEVGQLALCLPYGDDPSGYTWPVTDLSLILNHTGGLASLGLSKFAFELINQGARQVTIFCEQGNGIKVFNRKKGI